jgi:hypothetical protein
MTEIEQTRQVTAGDFSFNECALVISTTMTTKDGNLRRMEDGDIMPFDFIWNDILEMETDVPEDPESSIRRIMLRRIEEMKSKYPEKLQNRCLWNFGRPLRNCITLFSTIILRSRSQYPNNEE